MKEKKYNIYSLGIVTKKETRNINTLHNESAATVVKFIKRAIQKGNLQYLCANFGNQDDSFIVIHANETYACVFIHDAVNNKSYDYCNKKYENNMTEVELFGYYFCKACLCEDKDILFDIIIYFFETGKINEKYEWYETDLS